MGSVVKPPPAQQPPLQWGEWEVEYSTRQVWCQYRVGVLTHVLVEGSSGSLLVYHYSLIYKGKRTLLYTLIPLLPTNNTRVVALEAAQREWEAFVQSITETLI